MLFLCQKKQKKNRRALGKLGDITGEFIFIRIWQPSSVDRDLPILPTVHPLFKFTIGIYKKTNHFYFRFGFMRRSLDKKLFVIFCSPNKSVVATELKNLHQIVTDIEGYDRLRPAFVLARVTTRPSNGLKFIWYSKTLLASSVKFLRLPQGVMQ